MIIRKKKHGDRTVNSCFIFFYVIVNFHVLYSCDKKILRISNLNILARHLVSARSSVFRRIQKVDSKVSIESEKQYPT